jgi:membrane protease YdiL (CAAX protease family)
MDDSATVHRCLEGETDAFRTLVERYQSRALGHAIVAFWIAIVLVAVLFGLGHLPATSRITPLTTMLILRALVLNGIAAIAFGYLYWRHGLEAAMIGHMGAHLVMQIPGVIILTRML